MPTVYKGWSFWLLFWYIMINFSDEANLTFLVFIAFFSMKCIIDFFNPHITLGKNAIILFILKKANFRTKFSFASK